MKQTLFHTIRIISILLLNSHVAAANSVADIIASDKSSFIADIKDIKYNKTGQVISMLVIGNAVINSSDADGLKQAQEEAIDDARKNLSLFINTRIKTANAYSNETQIDTSQKKAISSEKNVYQDLIYSQAAISNLKLIKTQISDDLYTVFMEWKSTKDIQDFTQHDTQSINGAILHSAINSALANDPVVWENGNKIIKLATDTFIFLGIGRESLSKNTFIKAKKNAEIKADTKLAELFSSIFVNTQTYSNKNIRVGYNRAAYNEYTEECYTSLLNSSLTGIEDLGYRIENNMTLYCVRGIFIGNRKNSSINENWLQTCHNIQWEDGFEYWQAILCQVPWIAAGGCTVIQKPNGAKYLVVVESCSQTLPYVKAIKILHARAQKQVSSFFNNKLSQKIKINSVLKAKNDYAQFDKFRENKSEKLSSGEIQAIQKITTWDMPKWNAKFACFIYPLSNK